jgi:hypothetical protein
MGLPSCYGCRNDWLKTVTSKTLELREEEISFNVGVQFGLTDFTSDTAVKFQGSIGF